jgi:hypothetical protein
MSAFRHLQAGGLRIASRGRPFSWLPARSARGYVAASGGIRETRSRGAAHDGMLQACRRSLLHTTTPVHASKDSDEPVEAPGAPTKLGRFVYTAEVAVSKLFPAGFGWQLSSCYAESVWGLGDTDLGFFVVTGIGDFCGVFAGHFTYYTLKKVLYDKSIVVGEQAHVSLWLATAAAMSGGMWQPFVNFFQSEGIELSFNSSMAATLVCCGSMFYTGLRGGRYFYSAVLTGVPRGNYYNLIADAQLSVAIGGATACFVGTDVSYMDANWLRPIIGVEDGMSNVHGAILAGTSTALGFGAVQSAQNVVYPMGRCWVD